MLTRKNQLQRVFLIHQRLAAGGFTSVQSLAEELGVHPRSIKRDIEYLRVEMAAPIKTSRRGGGYYYSQPFTLLPDGLFDPHELLSLCLAYHIADTTEHTPYLLGLKKVVLKLLGLLGARELLTTFANVSVNAPPPRDGDEAPGHFKQLLDALNAHHQVSLRYFAMSRNEESTRTVDPQWIYYQDDQWYLLAFCHLREEIRRFAIGRIREITPLADTFTPLTPGEIENCLRNEFVNAAAPRHRARIWFDASVAPRVRERYWAAGQHIDPPQDDAGPCILTLSVDSLELLLRQLLPFGRHVNPLAPPELLELLRAEAAGLMEVLALPENNFEEAIAIAEKVVR